MAQITLSIDTINGESALANHVGELEALSIRDAILAPTTAGSAHLSEVFLTRFRDKASPKLAEACALGSDLGTMVVSVFRNTETGPTVMMTYELTHTYVSRIEHETNEEGGGAFLPYYGYGHLGESSLRPYLVRAGLTMNADRRYSRKRAQPTPTFPQPTGAAASNAEVERIWLNPATITWSYKIGGTVEYGWDLQKNKAIAAEE